MGFLEYGEYEYIRERKLIDKHKTFSNGQQPSRIEVNYTDNPKEYKLNGFRII